MWKVRGGSVEGERREWGRSEEGVGKVRGGRGRE